MGNLTNRYLEWFENEILSKPTQDPMGKPYWSYDDIINVAIQQKLILDSDEDHYKFKADLTNHVSSFIKNNNFFIITNISQRLITSLIDSPGYPFICMIFPLIIQLFFYWTFRLAIYFEALSPQNNTQIFISAYWSGWLGIAVFFAILMIAVPAVVAFVFLYFNKNKSLRCRYLYNLLLANVHGYNDQLYDSGAIIDFLNSRYRFNLPKDPFRAWKEPFFKRNGEFWIIGFNGKRICLGLRKHEFYEQLAFLLSRPGESFYCLNLEKPHTEADTDEEDEQVLIQNQENKKIAKGLFKSKGSNIADLKTYLADLEESKDDAFSLGNIEKMEQLEDQIDQLKHFMNTNFTKSGEPKDIDPGIQKIRNTIKKRIERIIEDIEPYHPELSAHLTQYVTRGYNLCYHPPPGSEPWDIKY